MALQRLIEMIYPPQCLLCDVDTDADFGLCGACWTDVEFLSEPQCKFCGAEILGDPKTEIAQSCEDCFSSERPWIRGTSVARYSGAMRKLVLLLKHGDRTDIARGLGRMLERAAERLQLSDPLVVPIPLHWTRLLRRRYNQSAFIAQALVGQTGWTCLEDGLVRCKRTRSLDGQSRDQRFDRLDGAIRANHNHLAAFSGRSILLVDDVMTSGATCTSATRAALCAGANDVSVLTLARVAKEA